MGENPQINYYFKYFTLFNFLNMLVNADLQVGTWKPIGWWGEKHVFLLRCNEKKPENFVLFFLSSIFLRNKRSLDD